MHSETAKISVRETNHLYSNWTEHQEKVAKIDFELFIMQQYIENVQEVTFIKIHKSHLHIEILLALYKYSLLLLLIN